MAKLQSHNIERLKEASALIKEVMLQEWDSLDPNTFKILDTALGGINLLCTDFEKLSEVCNFCAGTGTIKKVKGFYENLSRCNHCNGTGKIEVSNG